LVHGCRILIDSVEFGLSIRIEKKRQKEKEKKIKV
jgi:hypothetical protein